MTKETLIQRQAKLVERNDGDETNIFNGYFYSYSLFEETLNSETWIWMYYHIYCSVLTFKFFVNIVDAFNHDNVIFFYWLSVQYWQQLAEITRPIFTPYHRDKVFLYTENRVVPITRICISLTAQHALLKVCATVCGSFAQRNRLLEVEATLHTLAQPVRYTRRNV